MGYTTEFSGTVSVVPPLNAAEVAYLRRFSGTRRMGRTKGPYYVDAGGFAGQDRGEDIHDYNSPPAGQPGLWCHWVPTDDGSGIEWDGGAKFYHAEAWMQYVIDHFLRPAATASTNVIDGGQFSDFTFDHVLNGAIDAQGEVSDDRWRLVVKDNVVWRIDAVITFPEDPEETDTTLWAMHVLGPDDIVAMPDRATAEAKAAEVNAIAEMLRRRPTAWDLDPHLSAAVIEWTGTAAEHAADLAENGTEYSPL
jgi:hypothetical protein